MKKLFLIPLIIAISGCSNNLSYKTNDGKILIKDETVEIEKKLSREDLKILSISKFNKQKKIKERNINYVKRRLREEIRTTPNVGELLQEFFEEKQKKEIEGWERKLAERKDEFDSWLQRNESIVRSFTESLKDSPEIHANFISFTAIKTDLIGNKAILPRITLTCFNPSLIQKYKIAWSEFLDEEQQKTAPNIICDKYAKF